MRIRMRDRVPHEGSVYQTGEAVDLDDATARRWVDLGWADDMTGQIPTGARSMAPVVVTGVTTIITTGGGHG